MSARAVFLDRDGVLNRVHLRDGLPYPPARMSEMELLGGAAAACRQLAAAGWILFVVTNQPEIARGTKTASEVDEMNAAVVDGLPVLEVLVCPHDDADLCTCRKPEPGMLISAAERWDVDLGCSVMIGDRWRDIQAGHDAGTKTVLVGDGYGEVLTTPPDLVVASLADAARAILESTSVLTPRQDDWESHWSEYSDSATDNPAQMYRRELIVALIERGGVPKRILDIGSGQGDLLASLGARFPSTELAGIEVSAEGMRRTREKAPTARLFQIDLLLHEVPTDLAGWADLAVCSEVVEHVDDPTRLLRAASRCLTRGGRIVVTAPGGPRTAFDRYIGHRRHYRAASLRATLEAAEFVVTDASGSGFPFFNLYKLVVFLRGRALIRDVSSEHPRSRSASVAMRCFRTLLDIRTNSRRFGWQIVALAHRRT